MVKKRGVGREGEKRMESERDGGKKEVCLYYTKRYAFITTQALLLARASRHLPLPYKSPYVSPSPHPDTRADMPLLLHRPYYWYKLVDTYLPNQVTPLLLH